MDGSRNPKNTVDSRNAMKRMRFRYYLIAGILLLVAVPSLLYSIVHIQLVEGAEWRKWEHRQSRDSLKVEPLRGSIFSSDGALMATSMTTYQLYIDFRAYSGNGKMEEEKEMKAKKKYKDSLDKYIDTLSVCLSSTLKDKPASQYKKEILDGFDRGQRDKRYRTHLLSRVHVDYLTYQEIKKFPFFHLGRGVTGLHDKPFLERKKVFGSLAGSTMGYVDPATGHGRYGLEQSYDSILSGKPGWSSYQRVGNRYVSEVTVAPTNGYDIYTTIDIPIQDIVEKSLREAMEKHQPKSGTAILMEVKTGRIRAICNLERTRDGSYVELQNIGVTDYSEPGSTFKTVSMMACLEEQRVKPTDLVDAGSGVKKFHTLIMKDDGHSFGVITAGEVIQHSSNIGMATLVEDRFRQGKDAAVFVDRIYKMGFNRNLNLEIKEASIPSIPHPATYKKWSKTSLPWMSIGYGVAIPPIYTLSYYNAIANDGCYLRPYFVDRIQQGDKVVQEFKPVVVNEKICSDSTLHSIRLMLDSVLIKGTARKSRSDIVEMAGKTGTAQIGYSGGSEHGHQASFCAYFPAHAPEYTCIVVIRLPKNGYSGGTVSAPVVRRIAEQVYSREHNLSLDELVKDEASDVAEQSPVIAPVVSSDAVQRDYGTGKVPDVVGLGLKDAIHLLEKSQLKFYVQGHGKVVRQTPKAGTPCRAGNTVEIYLK